MIKHVYVFQNGMVMTFDDRGDQMPEYQGPEDEVLPKLKKAKADGENFVIEYRNWRDLQ